MGLARRTLPQVLEVTHNPKLASLNSDAVVGRPMSDYELIFLRFR